MSIRQEKSPTFQLRKICDRIQVRISQLLGQFNHGQLQTPSFQQLNQVKKWDIKQSPTKFTPLNVQQPLLQKLRNDLCRIISSQLPQVVNYQQRANDHIEELQQQLDECKKLHKKQKENYKQSIQQQDKLREEILQLNESNKCLQKELVAMKEQYDGAVNLCGKYMKEIRSLQVGRSELLQQRMNEGIKKYQLNNTQLPLLSLSPSHKMLSFPKERQIDIPLQMKQKLNKVEKIPICSPKYVHIQVQQSQFYLPSQIVGCQKQLLQIQLRGVQVQKAQVLAELQEERAYSRKLQKQSDDLEKLLDGEKKLNQKLDRQLFIMINSSNQMKIQLLQEKTKNKQLQGEIKQLEEHMNTQIKEMTQLRSKITHLQLTEKQLNLSQDQLIQFKTKLEITENKYQSIRKIKQQLQGTIDHLHSKLYQLEKDKSQTQLNTENLLQTIKAQNLTKVKQIEQMSHMIKQKYQEKLNIREKQYQQLKEKYKLIKHHNDRLYDEIEIQAKKEIKLQDKYTKANTTLQQLQEDNRALKKEKEAIQEKWKNQSLLNKELKRELTSAEKNKLLAERKAKILQISKLPNLLAQVQLLKDEAMMIRTTIIAYKEMISKITAKNCLQFEHKIASNLEAQKESIQALRKENFRKTLLLQSLNKQSEETQVQKAILLQRNTQLQSREQSMQQLLQVETLEKKKLTEKFFLFQEKNNNLQKQLESCKKLQKSSTQQIQLLKTKNKKVETLYDLVNELTSENEKLKLKLDKFMIKKQKEKLNKHNEQEYATLSPSAQKNSISLSMIPQNLSKQLNTHSNINLQGHTCAYKPLSKNKSSMLKQMPKSPSRQNRYHHHPTHYQQTLPNNILIYTCPDMLNSRKNVNLPGQKLQTISFIDDNSGIYNQSEIIMYDFESQKLRLHKIKREYQRLMDERFRDELS